jgi:hypothetical protein
VEKSLLNFRSLAMLSLNAQFILKQLQLGQLAKDPISLIQASPPDTQPFGPSRAQDFDVQVIS